MLFKTLTDARTLKTSWRWPHFRPAELACRCGQRFCGGAYWHAPDFLDGLEAVRAHVGRPLIINSGHRCDLWNAAVGGAPLSRHKQIAVDIALAGNDRFRLRDAARAAGFTGFGFARSFLHLDRRSRAAQWYYKGSEASWQT
ncbi:MAG: D-Ala-D-Ala carboxypeptidase family metallohydrolase [Pseudomonadota bacterium]